MSYQTATEVRMGTISAPIPTSSQSVTEQINKAFDYAIAQMEDATNFLATLAGLPPNPTAKSDLDKLSTLPENTFNHLLLQADRLRDTAIKLSDQCHHAQQRL